MAVYKDSGVDNDVKEQVSRIFYDASRQTWENRKGRLGEVLLPFDHFSGTRVIDVGGLPKGTVMCKGFDGIGTKLEIAERLGKHDTVAYDLIAMVADDVPPRGGEAVLVGSILDVRSWSVPNVLDYVHQLAYGLVGAAGKAGVAVINGEVAELGARVSGYGDFNYNWGAGIVWFARKDRLLTGTELKPGQSLVALHEPGFRSNGLSLPRKLLTQSYGPDWHVAQRAYAEQLLIPSTIYCGAMTDMMGGVEGEQKVKVAGVAHITGGGIPEKLGRMFRPSGYGAVLENLFLPCSLMHWFVSTEQVSLEEAYKTWNMGNGMIIATEQPELTCFFAKQHGLEAKVAGAITAEPGIRIKTFDDAVLTFNKD